MQERHHVCSLSSVSLHLSSTPQSNIMKQQQNDENKIIYRTTDHRSNSHSPSLSFFVYIYVGYTRTVETDLEIGLSLELHN